MSSSMLEQRSRFAMIGALMIIISLMFWYYMGSSLVSATKKYLEQVVAPLATAGLLTVTRGYQGGYQLSRPPEAITLADVIAASEDGLALMGCTSDLLACERAGTCPSRSVWSGLQNAVNDYLESKTLADMVKTA